MRNTAEKIFLLALVCLFAPFALSAADAKKTAAPKPELSLGTWHYGVFLGKVRLGTAHVSLSFENGQYLSSSNMTMQRGDGAVVCVMNEIEKEKADFTPVSYFSSTTIISGTKESRALINATFADGVVTIKDAEGEHTVTVKGKFYITPNVLAVKMEKEGLKPGALYKVMVYDPTVDEEKAVEMTEKVIGPEVVDLPSGGKSKLVHTVQTLGPLKNIHNYLDERKIPVRTSMTMLNQTIDLMLEGYDAPKGKK